MAGQPDRVAVGRVRGLHGLRGAVRVEVLTDRPDERFAVGAKLIAGARTLTVAEVREVPGGRGLFIRFDRIADRNAAEALRDLDLEVEVDPAEDLDGDAVFWHELHGVRVVGRDGRDLGTIRDVYRAGATEVLTVAGGTVRPFEMPVVRAFIDDWAPREGRIVVDADALGVEPLAYPGEAAEPPDEAAEPTGETDGPDGPDGPRGSADLLPGQGSGAPTA
jgi:16S rRNA processing protein RimM